MEFFALKSLKKEFQARTFRKIPELIFYLFLLLLPMWFTFALIPQHMINGNTYYLLWNNLYLLCCGCQYLMRLSYEVQIFSCFQTFSNSKFMLLVRELQWCFKLRHCSFPQCSKTSNLVFQTPLCKLKLNVVSGLWDFTFVIDIFARAI